MAIKHAVLGLLLERRGYGYDLIQRLEQRLGPAWQLNPSTVYAALDQLEDEQLILARQPERPAPLPRRAQRRVFYEATEPGRVAFEEWLRRPAAQLEPIRGELQLKVAVAREEDLPDLLDAVDHAELITRMLHEECRETAAREEGAEPSPHNRLAQVAALLRLEGELRWLSAAREALSERRPARTGKGAFRRESLPADPA